ncbi:MAG: hypothetical protein ABII90_04000 [Bacteroidota bacterium]
MANKYNIHLIKSRRSYSIKDMTTLFNIDRKTCSRWIEYKGLKVMEMIVNPPLVMGSDLKEFIQKQRATRRIRLAEGEYYCLKCHKSVKAKVGSEKTIKTDKKIGKNNSDQYKKIGNCEVCGTRVNRFLGVCQQD